MSTHFGVPTRPTSRSGCRESPAWHSTRNWRFYASPKRLFRTRSSTGEAPIVVVLRQRKAGTELVVSDLGPGFDADELPRTLRTMGLVTMRERAADIHASLSIESRAGAGTEVRVFLPATAVAPGG